MLSSWDYLNHEYFLPSMDIWEGFKVVNKCLEGYIINIVNDFLVVMEQLVASGGMMV
jgi:hypothetical protein